MTTLAEIIAIGLDAGKPADPPTGTLYKATDTDTLERWNGTTWETYAPAGGGLTQEQVEDAVAALVVAGTGITATYADATPSLTIASTITQYTDEMARDALAAALTAGSNVTITPNDGADTITIDATGGGGGVTLEQVYDALATVLVAGTNMTITPNDGADTITFDATGGGGGGGLFVTLGPWYTANVVADGGFALSTIFMNSSSSMEVFYPDTFFAPVDGEIVGGIFNINDARTAGSIKLRATINGTVDTSVDFSTIDATNPLRHSSYQATGVSFSAGDLIGAAVFCTGFAPTTTDGRASLIVRWDV